MADGLTINDLEQIKADAAKAVNRQFRDAAEDHGWKPTPTPDTTSAAIGIEPAPLDEADSPSTDPSLNELRAQAKELGLSAGGSKEDIAARIAEAVDAEASNQEGQ